MSRMTKRTTLTLIALASVAAILLALPVRAVNPDVTLPDDPETLAQNGDGFISFDEFVAVTAPQHVTETRAAREFTRLSGPDAKISTEEYLYAERIETGPLWDKGYEVEERWTLRGRILNVTPNEEVAGVVTHAFEDEIYTDDLVQPPPGL